MPKYFFRALKRLIIITSFFSFGPCFAGLNQNNDFQLWTREIGIIPVDKSKFHLSFEERFGNDASELFYYYAQGQFIIPIDKYFSIAPSYRQMWDNDNDKRLWKNTYQPFIDFFIKRIFCKTTYLNRARINYIKPEHKQASWEYRNLIQINLPWYIGKAQVYFSDEIFIRERIGFFQNRLIGGLELPLTEKLQGDLYFLLRFHESSNTWIHQNVFGMVLRYHF